MAYDKIREFARNFVPDLPLILPEDFDLDGLDSLLTVLRKNDPSYRLAIPL